MPMLGQKLHHLPHFQQNKYFPKNPNYFLMCVIRYNFRKNLIKRFKEKFKNVNFGPKNDPFHLPFVYKNVPWKYLTLNFYAISNACHQVQFQKNLEKRFSEKKI